MQGLAGNPLAVHQHAVAVQDQVGEVGGGLLLPLLLLAILLIVGPVVILLVLVVGLLLPTLMLLLPVAIVLLLLLLLRRRLRSGRGAAVGGGSKAANCQPAGKFVHRRTATVSCCWCGWWWWACTGATAAAAVISTASAATAAQQARLPDGCEGGGGPGIDGIQLRQVQLESRGDPGPAAALGACPVEGPQPALAPAAGTGRSQHAGLCGGRSPAGPGTWSGGRVGVGAGVGRRCCGHAPNLGLEPAEGAGSRCCSREGLQPDPQWTCGCWRARGVVVVVVAGTVSNEARGGVGRPPP